MQHLYYLRFWLMQIQNAVSMRNEKMTQNNDIEIQIPRICQNVF